MHAAQSSEHGQEREACVTHSEKCLLVWSHLSESKCAHKLSIFKRSDKCGRGKKRPGYTPPREMQCSKTRYRDGVHAGSGRSTHGTFRTRFVLVKDTPPGHQRQRRRHNGGTPTRGVHCMRDVGHTEAGSPWYRSRGVDLWSEVCAMMMPCLL
jgi:hypothetical protein